MDDPPFPLELDPSLAPVLLFNCGRGGAEPDEATDDACRLVYSIPKKQVMLARGLGSLIDDVSWITPQGWVLKLDPVTRHVSLRDPFTSSRIVHLPSDPDGLLASSDDTRCVMSTHRPTDPGCVVLVIHRKDPVLCYCLPGEKNRWFRHEYRPELLVDRDSDEFIDDMIKVSAAGGSFYTGIFWEHDKLAKLEFSPEPVLSCSPVTDPRPYPAGCHYRECCLVESCGDLFMVQFCYTQLQRRITCVQVKKLDRSRRTFFNVQELGINRVFFVSKGQFGASRAADELDLKPNCVYFSVYGDKGLYTYDLIHGTTKLHNTGLHVPDSMKPILLMPVS